MKEKHLSERPCPVCGGKRGSVIVQLCYALFDDLDISGKKTLIECAQCGMFYDDVHFSEKQLQEYYRRNEHYASSSVGGSGGFTKDSEERYDRIINLLEPDSSGIIIDFGCGQGGFVSRCLKHGLQAVGIETSPKSLKLAQESGLCVYESLNSFINENDTTKIHAVVLSHVIEHLIDPANLVRVFAKYANGALVYIEVPDASSYLLPDAVCWHEMYFEHLSHFSERNIVEFAKRSFIDVNNNGKISFSKLQENVKCCYITGQFSLKQTQIEVPVFSGYGYKQVLQVPIKSLENLMDNDSPLGLWGVSQYAMLLLGSCEKLAMRSKRIFDSSPAKIGRSIQGIVVESSNMLGTLSEDCILLIPKSNFLQQMFGILPETGFKGTAVEI